MFIYLIKFKYKKQIKNYIYIILIFFFKKYNHKFYFILI